MSHSVSCFEPFSFAAIHLDCTCGFAVELFNGTYETGIHIVFRTVAQKATVEHRTDFVGAYFTSHMVFGCVQI